MLSTYIFCLTSISQTLALFIADPAKVQQTKCVANCPLAGDTVCGSDGKTYLTSCHLQKQACEKKLDIKVEHPGSCECPKTCLRHYKPVCALDISTKKEKTYPNICQFKKKACLMKEHKKELLFTKRGPCKRMSKCPLGCQDIFAPVCGGDNRTYSSVCALKLAACNKNKKISLIKIGKCQPGECPEQCPMAYQPLCGNDGHWYPSLCELKLTACKTRTVIKRIKGKRARKTCGKKCVLYCPQLESPVCGTDGVTYINECMLYKTNCQKGKKVKVAKRTKCRLLSNNTNNKK